MTASGTGHAIPLFATGAALEPLLPEIAERQRRVLESGRYILGPEVEAFEEEFAAYVGRRHCVGVANGTEALTIALRALGVGRDEEVVMPAFTFFATAEAVVNAGGRPVFCDIDPRTHCMTAATAEAVITRRTRALLPVHMFGNPAPMDELCELARSRRLRVLEDAAQAAGARYRGRMAGALGDAAGFSFYPGKNLAAFGDAGAIVTDNSELARLARRLRAHGSGRNWVHTEVGYNSRLDELQAAALRVVLPHLDDWTRARRQVAAWYGEAGLGELVEPPAETRGAQAAYHLHVSRTPLRDELIELLGKDGIEARAYYTPALHQQPALTAYTGGSSFPNAERLAGEGIALPIGPAMQQETAARVVDAIARALGS
jgi:dTDP-3-amino-3,4,6-trideoxy-alpha-D-glucose transaminase